MSIASRVVARSRAAWVARLVARERELYERGSSVAQVRSWQLERWNEQWERLRRSAVYYRDLQRQARLPERFDSWEEFHQRFPIADRAEIRTCMASMEDRSVRARGARSTGGTTAEPLTFPVSREEVRRAAVDAWLGRSRLGLTPSDRLFLLWGHSHILGSGPRGRARAMVRRWKDGCLGYQRWSAYDLGEKALAAAGEALIAFQPDWVLGYSVALDRFARANAGRRAELHRSRLKTVIATAEAFPRPDSREAIEDTLGCPVAMEYGTVETGPIAYETTGGDYRVFWRRFHLESLGFHEEAGGHEIAVTALDPRRLPLVRYRIGDLVTGDPAEFDIRFERVVGRCNDALRLGSGDLVHSEAFTHAIRDLPGVQAFQVVQRLETGEIALEYLGPAPLLDPVVAELRRRLARVHQDLAGIGIDRVERLPTTIAGKTKRIRMEA